MEVVLSIIAIVWGVLNIVLFFKVWGMCNDVSEILSLHKKSGTITHRGTDATTNVSNGKPTVIINPVIQEPQRISKFIVGEKVVISKTGEVAIVSNVNNKEYECVSENGTRNYGFLHEDELDLYKMMSSQMRKNTIC